MGQNDKLFGATRSTGTSTIPIPSRRCAIDGLRRARASSTEEARLIAKSSSAEPPESINTTSVPAMYWPSQSDTTIEIPARRSDETSPLKTPMTSRSTSTPPPAARTASSGTFASEEFIPNASSSKRLVAIAMHAAEAMEALRYFIGIMRERRALQRYPECRPFAIDDAPKGKGAQVAPHLRAPIFAANRLGRKAAYFFTGEVSGTFAARARARTTALRSFRHAALVAATSLVLGTDLGNRGACGEISSSWERYELIAVRALALSLTVVAAPLPRFFTESVPACGL